MKKIIVTILILGLITGVVWYFSSNKKTEEDLIREQISKLADACVKTGKETSITMAIKNSQFANFTTSSCSITIPQAMMNGNYTPMEFAGSITRSRAMFNSLKGKVEEFEITVSPDKQKAIVDYAVRVHGRMKKGDAFDEARDLRSEMQKEDGIWKISSFEIREVLEK